MYPTSDKGTTAVANILVSFVSHHGKREGQSQHLQAVAKRRATE